MSKKIIRFKDASMVFDGCLDQCPFYVYDWPDCGIEKHQCDCDVNPEDVYILPLDDSGKPITPDWCPLEELEKEGEQT